MTRFLSSFNFHPWTRRGNRHRDKILRAFISERYDTREQKERKNRGEGWLVGLTMAFAFQINAVDGH